MKNKRHYVGADFKNSTLINGIYLGSGTSTGSGYSNGKSHGAYHWIRWNERTVEREQYWVHPKGDCSIFGIGVEDD